MSIVKEREIRLLEFDHIRDYLAQFSVTPMGKEKAFNLYPCEDISEIKNALQETTEACNLLEKSYLQIEKIPEIRPYLQKVGKDGILDVVELLRIKTFTHAIRRLQKKMDDNQLSELCPLIMKTGKEIEETPVLLSKLDNCIGIEEEILDTASSNLKGIREKKNHISQSIQEKLNHIIKSPTYSHYLQEPLITIRNERYVVPVKQEHQGKLKGIYHDQSSSGATYYIEPFGVVELQNKLQQQKQAEKKEIERILAELSEEVRTKLDILWHDLEIYSKIDFILAKGRLSYYLKCIEPEVTEETMVDIIGARHPMLKESAVPIDVKLGEKFRVLVITGPNTGGKTVTLKTVGLLAIMLQSGLHLPVSAGTKMGIFKNIRADIGDEQSLEQSLSTFSGHLTNIIEIMEEAGTYSLILLDELGAGTDPSEGAALARSILMELYEKGSLVISSTHINELKMFAQVEEGVQNASLEFDVDTLSPTYRLITGIPGSSNAIDVAYRLGLSEKMIERARNYLSQEHAEVEKIIKSLGDEEKRLKEDSDVASVERKQAEDLRRELEKEKANIQQRKEEIIAKAKAEARDLVKQAKRQVDHSIGEIHKTLASLKEEEKKEGENLENPVAEAEKIRYSLQEFWQNINDTKDESPEGEKVVKENLHEGDRVWVKNIKKEGVIKYISSDRDDVQVQVGDLRINTTVEELRMPDNRERRKNKLGEARPYTFQKAHAHVSPEIDLRGLTLNEAEEHLEQYLDKALLTGLEQVSVIHGKGTGKLRKGLQDLLESHSNVVNHRPGNAHEGGLGVTIVYLK